MSAFDPPVAPGFEAAQARFLALCAGGRYAEAESIVSIVYSDGSTVDGSEVEARGAFYEEWADAVIDDDPAEARTAYAQAEEYYAQFASWATAGGEGLARMIDVDRVRDKLHALDTRT